MNGPLVLLLGAAGLSAILVVLVLDFSARRRDLRLVSDRMQTIKPVSTSAAADTRGIAPPESLERLPA